MSRIYQTKGIVFRTIKYGESSLISDIFTFEKGLRSFILSGVRSKRSFGKANMLHPLNIVQLVAYEADEEKISRIKEVNFDIYYERVNLDVVTSAVGSFIMEICRKSIKEREANHDLYYFLEESLKLLDSGKTPLGSFHIKFMLDLAYLLGFGPLGNYDDKHQVFDCEEGFFTSMDKTNKYTLDPQLSGALNDMMQIEQHQLDQIAIRGKLRDQLLDAMIMFYGLHVPGFGKIKSLDILRTILS